MKRTTKLFAQENPSFMEIWSPTILWDLMGSITNSMIFVIFVSKNMELPPPAEPSNVGGSLFFFRQSMRLVVNKTDKYTYVYINIYKLKYVSNQPWPKVALVSNQPWPKVALLRLIFA